MQIQKVEGTQFRLIESLWPLGGDTGEMRLGMQEAAALMFRQEVTGAGGGGMGGWQSSGRAASLSWGRTVLFQLRESREACWGFEARRDKPAVVIQAGGDQGSLAAPGSECKVRINQG